MADCCPSQFPTDSFSTRETHSYVTKLRFWISEDLVIARAQKLILGLLLFSIYLTNKQELYGLIFLNAKGFNANILTYLVYPIEFPLKAAIVIEQVAWNK